MAERNHVRKHDSDGDGEVEDRDRHAAEHAGPLRRLSTPQWVLAVLSAALLLTGVAELLVAGWSWVRLTHVVSGIVLLGVAPWPRLIRPTVLLVGAVYVFQYVREAIPGGPNDQLDPASDPTLILNGFILVGLMVALMWPWPVHRR